ncbi:MULTISPECIES: hypothetical protein [Brucella]
MACPQTAFRYRLWFRPDCDLKTRNWDEVRPALVNMMATALRKACRGKPA